MRRRKFLQYAGASGLSFGVAMNSHAFSKPLAHSDNLLDLELERFTFRTATLDKKGQIRYQKQHTAQYFPEALSHADSLEMVAITPGRFWMGGSSSESLTKADEFPRHRVDVSAFFISKYPITQAQWAAVAALPTVKRELNPYPAHFNGTTRPVESVSYLDAIEFCQRLSQKTGHRYQLPSEAQWEYACRAGTETPFNTGATITSQFSDYMGSVTYQSEQPREYRQSTVPVGTFAPNAFGLHDMHGNVWEWCADSWHANYRGAPTNGQAWMATRTAQRRTIRGGGWLDSPSKIRSASRSGYAETALNRTIGFRVVTA